MFESINVCDEPAPDLLVVVRLGSNALIDEHLAKSTAECHARWGIWGFFILEVPDGDFAALARLCPIITTRRLLLAAHGEDLVASGFPLVPMLDEPHWSVTLAAPTVAAFAEVRSQFVGPIDNPPVAS